MNYDALNDAYNVYLRDLASKNNMTVSEYLKTLVHNSQLTMHTLELTDMMKGYIESGKINLILSEEGLLDIDGNKTR